MQAPYLFFDPSTPPHGPAKPAPQPATPPPAANPSPKPATPGRVRQRNSSPEDRPAVTGFPRSLRKVQCDGTAREGEVKNSSSGNDVNNKLGSEAQRALRENSSVDRVWNFALEELGRINIKFDPAWMSEYNKVYFDPLQLKRFCTVQIVVAVFVSIMVVIDHPWGHTSNTQFQTSCFLAEVTGQHYINPQTYIPWTFLRLMSMVMNVVFGIATLLLLSCMRLREMVLQRFSSLAALHLMISIASMFLGDVGFDCRRVPEIVFYSDVGLPIFNNFSYSGMTLDYSCNDTSYYETLKRWNLMTSVGCSPPYGSGLLVWFTFFSIGSALNIGDRACASLTLVGCFLCVIFMFLRAVQKSAVLWFIMAMLCLVSAQDTMQCYFITAEKKKQFMQLKVKKLLNVLTEKLLQTVIPPNVLDAMPVLQAFSGKPASQRSVSDLEFKTACEIKMATMMFCSVDFDVSNIEDFDNMSKYLQALDKIVETSGIFKSMFKYQHVSTGSKFYLIINCPRVACPLDREQQEAEYPSSYYYDMVCLGFQLIHCTNEFSRAIGGSGGGKTIKMKVGINCGAVAGIVLGKCRRFYCLYGDAMNVAARMSANAKENGVCLSPQIAAHLPRKFASAWHSSDNTSPNNTSPAAHRAADVPSEELKMPSMRAAQGSCDAGAEAVRTPLDPSLRDGHSSLSDCRPSDGASVELCAEAMQVALGASEALASACACATPRFSVVSRGLHPIKGKGLMELFDVVLVDGGERRSVSVGQMHSGFTASMRKHAESWKRKQRVSAADVQTLVDEETAVKKMMNYSYNLRDPKMEADFLESQVYVVRARMTGALCLHSLFALFQMYAVMFPDIREYFLSHGSPDLKWRIELVSILLYTQVLVAFFVSILLILWLWRMEAWPLLRGLQMRPLQLFANGERGVGKERSEDGGGRAAGAETAEAEAEAAHAAAAPVRRGAVCIDESASLSAPLATVLAADKIAEKRLDRQTVVVAQYALIFLLLFFHAISVAAAQVWPQQSLVLAIFPACMLLNFGMSHTINGLSKRQNLALVLSANLLLLPTLYKIIRKELIYHAFQIAILPGLSTLSLAISHSFGFRKRRQFLNEYFLRKQLLALGSVLFDLVPPTYGLQLIKTEMPGYDSWQRFQMRGLRRVAALQLDICGFTTLSSSISPVELANKVNKLFSSFDEVVMGTDLFKIDTIGDAYIMVAWLNQEASELTGSGHASVEKKQRFVQDSTQEDATKCADMLLVAEAMLEIVNEHNQELSSPLAVRIGIGTGSVVAGMLGELTKRFSVQGEAMRVIAELEPSAQPGKVHCSSEFINILSACPRCKAGMLSSWDVQQVEQPSFSEPVAGQHLESYMLTHKMPSQHHPVPSKDHPVPSQDHPVPSQDDPVPSQDVPAT